MRSASLSAVERMMLGIFLYTLVQKGIRSSELRRRTNIRDAVEYAKKSKIKWHGTPCDIVMTLGTSSEYRDGRQRDGQIFHERSERQECFARVPRASTIHWTTLARDRDEWSGTELRPDSTYVDGPPPRPSYKFCFPINEHIYWRSSAVYKYIYYTTTGEQWTSTRTTGTTNAAGNRADEER
uniref:WWE domain-containing protein n=1 Tax=Haemonchus contortus TaxID=6289 RepID=A0A7I4Z3A0_HAECO